MAGDFNQLMERGPIAFGDPEPDLDGLRAAFEDAQRVLDLNGGGAPERAQPHLVIGDLQALQPAIVGHAGDNRQTGLMYAVLVRNDPPKSSEPVTAEDVRGEVAVVDSEGNDMAQWPARWTDKTPYSAERKFDPDSDAESLERSIAANGADHRLLTIAHYTQRGDFFLWSVQGTAYSIKAEHFTLAVRLRGSNSGGTSEARFACTHTAAELKWERIS